MKDYIFLPLLLSAVIFRGGFVLGADSEGISQRQIVLDAMRQRPDDPWPRGAGHVLLGEPGSPRLQKAYHEPGGSFSPSPGSFGVSFWVVDNNGTLLTTSDGISLEKIEQRYDWKDNNSIPDILTKTSYYESRWSFAGQGLWQLDLKPAGNSDYAIDVMIRSVGPAGGPIEMMYWDGNNLLVDHRWVINSQPNPKVVYLGTEDSNDWKNAGNTEKRCKSRSGWCYARIKFTNKDGFKLQIRDTQPLFKSPLSYRGTRSPVSCDLPDKRFEASLQAQVANLMMGYIGWQTCPGEPTNYPLAWERDGAYSVMAMARCGQLAAARELSLYFAENDFFGGFGAEGDAPGSEINALVEVASILNDPEYNQWIWPHVQRKVGTILEMLNAKGPIARDWVGPVLPNASQVICKAARDGLIVGAMDHHFPVLYVNAVSYRGLTQAARLAQWLGKEKEAKDYRQVASRIREAWLKGFETAEAKNERTYMSGIWPTWIVKPDFEPYIEAMRNRNFGKSETLPERPLWTYFIVGEAHQWLFIGKTGPVWRTLGYFWNNQCSPGLYTYWEGSGEENSFGLWPNYRGWVRPPYVTPHYWTASEMLLLHLDMLAYVDESGDEPVLVVGGGMPGEWIKQPMNVRGVQTSIGRVDWSYKDDKMVVDFYSRDRYGVRPGPEFKKDINMDVRYHKQ
jgi:hypothetical protein